MKNIYFPDFSCTHGRMCVYGRYAPVIRFFSILKNEIWKFLSHFATFGSETVIERNTFDHLDV